MKVNLTEQQLAVILEIVKKKTSARVVLFGSRVVGGSLPNSDLDLCLKSEKQLPLGVIEDLKELFRESSLPFVVDVSDYSRLPERYQRDVDQYGVEV